MAEKVKCAVKAKIIEELRKQEEMKARKESGGRVDFSSDPLAKQLNFAADKICEALESGRINESRADLFMLQLEDIMKSEADDETRLASISRIIGAVIRS